MANTKRNRLVTGKHNSQRARSSGTTRISGRPTTRGGKRSTGRTKRNASSKSKLPMIIILGVIVLVGGIAGLMHYNKGRLEEAERQRLAEVEAERQRELQKEQARRAELEEQKKRIAEEQRERFEEKERKRLEEEERASRAAMEDSNTVKETSGLDETTESHELDETLAKSRTAFKHGKFQSAATLLTKAMGMPRFAEMEPEQQASIQRAAELSELFYETVKATPISPEATTENLFVFTLKRGETFRAKVEKDSRKALEVINNAGISLVVEKDDIVKQTPVDEHAHALWVEDQIGKKVDSIESGVDAYLAGLEALRFKKRPTAAKLFLRAAAMDDDLKVSIREHEAALLFRRAVWDRSRGNDRAAKRRYKKLTELYPETNVAKVAKETFEVSQEQLVALAMEEATQPEPADTSGEELDEETMLADGGEDMIDDDMDEPVSTSSAGHANEGIKQADTLYRTAMVLVKKAQEAERRQDANKYYKQAVSKLLPAIQAYDAYLDTNGSDEAVEGKRQEAAVQLYWSRKLQAL